MNNANPSEKAALPKSPMRYFYPWILIALICALAPIAPYFLVFSGVISDQQAEWGQFGDFVGGVLNPVFGFFAFAAILYTLLLEREALRQQRAEARLETVDRHFYALLELKRELISKTDVFNEGGATGIRGVRVRMGTEDSQLRKQVPDANDRAKEAWNRIWNQARSQLLPAFRIVERTVELVCKKADDSGKEFCLGTLFSSMTEDEGAILFYYCCLQNEGKGLWNRIYIEMGWDWLCDSNLLQTEHIEWGKERPA